MTDIYKKQNKDCYSNVNNALEFLPLRMKAQRKDIHPTVKDVHGGIRLAAKIVGISPATYLRAEKGKKVTYSVMMKILYWLDKDAHNFEWMDRVMEIFSKQVRKPFVHKQKGQSDDT